MSFFVGSVVKTKVGADVKYQGKYITSDPASNSTT